MDHGNDHIYVKNIINYSCGELFWQENVALARQMTIAEAALLKNAGTEIFAIGVTDQIDADLLRTISSPPQQVNLH